MREHALIKLLKSFSKIEVWEFREFISNSYFNKRKAVTDLFEILRKYYPGFGNENLEKKVIFSKLFPGKKFNDASLTVHLHYLQELAKRFIAIRKFENDKLEYDLTLEYELFKRNQPGNPLKIVEKHLKDIDPLDYLSEVYYINRYRLKFDRMTYLFEMNSGVYEKFLHKVDFQEMYSDFYYHYLIKSMRLYLNQLHTEIIYNKEYDKEHFEKMMHEINVDDYKHVPLIQIYYYLIRMLNHDDKEKYYFKMKTLLQKNFKRINIDDLREIHINMQNFCKRRVAEEKNHFQREEFELLEKQLSSKTYLINETMDYIFYRNAVNIALKLKEMEWVKNFIHKFKNTLQEGFRQTTFYYCSAQYEFARKNYDTSLELLSKIKIDEVYLKYDVKILQMMIYYETGSYETLRSALEAFRHFLQNNEWLPEGKKIYYVNFHKFLTKLISSKDKKDKLYLIKFHKELSKEITVNNKFWLLRKMESVLR